MLMLELERPLDPGMEACHHCDNPPCCNGEHLYEGTHQQNMDDAKRRKRMASGDRQGLRAHPGTAASGDAHGSHTHPELRPRGEAHGRSTLTEAGVVALRSAFASGTRGAPLVMMAADLGVGERQLYRILRGDDWSHVPGAIAKKRLSPEDAVVVRAAHADGGVTAQQLADQHGVTREQVYYALGRR